MFLVGLTGGIGSGKSTVAAMFRDLGCSILDADIIAREVVEPGRPAWREIRRQFGGEVFHPDGTLDRERLGAIVFEDEAKRRALNSITHPEIYKAMVFQVFCLFLRGHQFVILDLPLLFESGKMVPYMSFTIVVYCDRATQLQRLCDHRGLSLDQARQRLDAQMPLAKKRPLATHVIDNEGGLEELRQRVGVVHRELLCSRAHWILRAALIAAMGAMASTCFVLYRLLVR